MNNRRCGRQTGRQSGTALAWLTFTFLAAARRGKGCGEALPAAMTEGVLAADWRAVM